MPHLISATALASRIESGGVVRLLDVRWRLDVPEGRPAYVAGHLPGAVYVDLERELSERGHPELGRYPLPALPDLEQAVRRWGIDDGDLVVAYDDNDGVPAARAWWLLSQQGIEVRVLDGGVRSWIAEGKALEQGDVAPELGTATLLGRDFRTATIEEAARAPQHGHLIDVRSPDHYRGRAQGLDPAAGHIPGAINIPTVAHLTQHGSLKAPEDILATLAAAGIDTDADIVLYCGTGVAAAHSAFALASAGVPTRIFTGSWSQWALARGRPIAVGRTPANALQGW